MLGYCEQSAGCLSEAEETMALPGNRCRHGRLNMSPQAIGTFPYRARKSTESFTKADIGQSTRSYSNDTLPVFSNVARGGKNRAGVEPGETQEDSRQEAPHSTGDPQAPESPQAHRRHSPQRRTATESQQPRGRDQASRAERQAHPVKYRIKWPKMSDTKAWEHLDADLEQVLEASLAGAGERKVESLTSITYNLARERFGVEEKKKRQQTNKQPNRRKREIRQLRREIKALNKKYKRGPVSEKESIKQLTCQLRERLCRLRRAESVRKQRKQRANKRAQFFRDPFRFTKSLLKKAKSGRLTSGGEEVEQFLREAHNDELRHEALEENPRIKPVPVPTKPQDTSETTWKEVQDVVRKARAGSALGPSGIPYKVYKKCPLLLRRLWRLLRRIWGKGVIPASWKRAEGCFILKEKGGIPGFSGCLEHTGVLTQLIREAKSNKSDLTVLWLDLANAYGSIPHGLIQVALDRYHVPASVKGMVTNYFGGIQLRFRTADFTTQWQNLEKGIVTGCTISPILFIMGMNLLIDAAATKAKGPRMNSGISQHIHIESPGHTVSLAKVRILDTEQDYFLRGIKEAIYIYQSTSAFT
ncbi:hypothetical protein Bbelb_281580 [Branchiostoma belcheri]|nr:hypothetical protein Bbelb_281580 [Branchiostoma belcheri]